MDAFIANIWGLRLNIWGFGQLMFRLQVSFCLRASFIIYDYIKEREMCIKR